MIENQYLETKKRWLTPAEAAKELAVSQKTIYRLCAEGRLVAMKVRNSLRIFSPSLDSFIHDQVQDFSLSTGMFRTTGPDMD